MRHTVRRDNPYPGMGRAAGSPLPATHTMVLGATGL